MRASSNEGDSWTQTQSWQISEQANNLYDSRPSVGSMDWHTVCGPITSSAALYLDSGETLNN